MPDVSQSLRTAVEGETSVRWICNPPHPDILLHLPELLIPNDQLRLFPWWPIPNRIPNQVRDFDRT